MMRFVVVVVLALAACRTPRQAGDETVCAEHRDIKCVTAVECTMDAARGCRVCQCAPWQEPATNPGGPPTQSSP